MNLGSLRTARRDWHITYTLLTSTCKVFVVKALPLFTVEQILSESWLLWSAGVRKGDENTQKGIVLPWENFCRAGQIWIHMSGLCFPGSIWWARMGFTGVRNGTRAKGPLGQPTAPAAPAQTETKPLFWVLLTSWAGSLVGFIRKELREGFAKVQSDCATPGGIWKGELEEVTGHPYFGFLNVP